MAKAFIEEDTLTAIGDAIRSKGNTTELLKPSEMAGAIRSMVVGEQVIPDSAFSAYATSYKYYGNNWNWFIEDFGHNIEYHIMAPYLFYGCDQLLEIPMRLETNWQMSFALANCSMLTSLPEITPTFLDNTCYLNNIFSGCRRIREIPDNFFGADAVANDWEKERPAKNFEGARQAIFNACWSLRKLPDLSPAINIEPDATNTLYYNMCDSCYVLDEITNLPVSAGTYNDNMFVNSFKNCYRLKNMTFEKNTDNSAKIANWANLADGVGYTSYSNYIYDYNSGITTGEVRDDATYWRYKDTDYWWASSYHYSRYDKASAVATINSLPDTSAYLATNGGSMEIEEHILTQDRLVI